jgi:hypothetical protein
MADSRGELVNRLEPIIKKVRDRRNVIEQQWLANHAAWRGQRTRVYYNSDFFKHYIPIARRATERTVVRMVQMLVPDNDFFEVYPGDVFDMGNTTAADAVSTFMLHLMERRVHIKSVVAQLARSAVMYGRAITKASVELVHWQEDAEAKVKHVDIWPTLRAVDVFSFYHFPETTNDLDRCQLLFEDSMYPWSEYLDAVEASNGLIDSISRRDLDKPVWPHHHMQRLSFTSMASPSDIPQVGKEGESAQVGDFVELTEGFMKSGQTWMHFWIVWNLKRGPRVVRLHKIVGDRQPYRLAVMREVPGESYTSSNMDDYEPLQILFNDQINRMEEAASIAAVPPVRVDPMKVSRSDSLIFRPRAKWLMEPDGAKLLEVPDTSRGSQAAAMMTMNLITSVFSPGGIVEGQPPRGSPRAGFAFSSMVNLSMADIKDMADCLEDKLLTPSLHDLYKLTVLFVPAEQVIRIPGTAAYKPQTMTTYDLYGGWSFRWVGQLQAQDMQVRGQRMQQFLQGVAPLLEALQMQGSTMDLAQLVKMIWRDVLGERGFDRILVKLPPPPMLPPGVTPPGAPGAAGDNPAQALAGMLGGPQGTGSAGTPENRERQASRQKSSQAGGPSQ